MQGGAGNSSGRISGDDGTGIITIVGNLTGGDGEDSGEVHSGGPVLGVKIGGSLQGERAGKNSGQLFTNVADMGFVTIGGSLIGGAGGIGSGLVDSGGKLAGVKVGGSVVGGSGIFSGRIASSLDMGFVTIGGDVAGDRMSLAWLMFPAISPASPGRRFGPRWNSTKSGRIVSGGALGAVKIAGGDVLGGVGLNSGNVFANAAIASVTRRSIAGRQGHPKRPCFLSRNDRFAEDRRQLDRRQRRQWP